MMLVASRQKEEQEGMNIIELTNNSEGNIADSRKMSRNLTDVPSSHQSISW